MASEHSIFILPPRATTRLAQRRRRPSGLAVEPVAAGHRPPHSADATEPEHGIRIPEHALSVLSQRALRAILIDLGSIALAVVVRLLREPVVEPESIERRIFLHEEILGRFEAQSALIDRSDPVTSQRPHLRPFFFALPADVPSGQHKGRRCPSAWPRSRSGCRPAGMPMDDTGTPPPARGGGGPEGRCRRSELPW